MIKRTIILIMMLPFSQSLEAAVYTAAGTMSFSRHQSADRRLGERIHYFNIPGDVKKIIVSLAGELGGGTSVIFTTDTFAVAAVYLDDNKGRHFCTYSLVPVETNGSGSSLKVTITATVNTDPDPDPGGNNCTCGACCICKCTCGKWTGVSCSGICEHNCTQSHPHDDYQDCECHHTEPDDDEGGCCEHHKKDYVAPLFGDMQSWLPDFSKQFGKYIKDGFSNIVGGIRDFIGSAVTKIGEIFKPLLRC